MKPGGDVSDSLSRSQLTFLSRSKLYPKTPPLIVCFFTIAFLFALPSRGWSAPQALERDIKAAYLYNFLFFVKWPQPLEERGRDISICLLGPDPFENAFRQVEGRHLPGGGILTVLRLAETEMVTTSGCSLLFLSRELDERVVREVLARLKGLPVLTVSDRPGFLANGGMIELVTVEERVRWRIHLGHVKSSGLGLSSQLLRNALDVEE